MKLDRIANIAVILVAIAFIGATIYDRVLPRSRKPTPPMSLMGKTLPLPGSATRGASATLVLFVSPACHFCTESMPFYGRLAALRPSGSKSFRLLAATAAGSVSDEEGRQYMASHGVAVDEVAQVSFPDVGIVATPTLALLDSSGRVAHSWTGKLSDELENDVIKSIRELCADCKGE